MADIESNIDININASDALANIKNLQRQISAFHQSMAKSGAQANAVSAQMQTQLINTINATGNFSASMRSVATTTESFTTALEKNKLSMGEYFRYAGGATRGFGKLFRTEFDTIEKVARERVKTLQTQYIKMGRDASGAMKAIEVRPLTLDMNDLGTKTAIAAQKQQIFNQLLKQGSTNLLNFGKNTQWAGRQLMVGFTIPLGMMGAAASREFMKIEEQALRFKRVYGETFTSSGETEKMIGQVRTLADEFTKYGVSIEKTMGLAADAAAMGKQGADLIAQVAEANKLAVLGGVEQAQALETTISLTNAFGTATDKLSGKVNFLNAVENQTVTSIEDLTEAIPKAGPVVQQLGGDVEDLAFFMTAMKEGGIDAGEGANALKSGLASMINPTQEATDMLAGLNINLKGIVDANKGDVAGTVVEFARALDTLDPLQRAQAIETLFGKFQFARMSTLFQNVIAEGSQASRVLQLTQATTEELAVLADREMKRIEDSPMYKFKAAMEDFKASLAPVGEAFLKAVTPIIEFGSSILSKFNDMSDGAKQFWTVLVAAVAGLGPVLLMTFGLMANGLANIIKMFGTLGGLFNRSSSQTNTLGQQTEYMSQQQLEAASIAASLNQVHSSLIQTFTSEAAAVDRLAAAYTKAVVAQQGMRQPMTARAGGGKAPKKYAKGVITVPGSGTGDTVPAMLTPGEAVIPADQAKKYAPLIQGMIAGSIQGYANGKQPYGSFNAYTNAVMYLDPTMNKEMGGKGALKGDVAKSISAGGKQAMAPLLAEIARNIVGPGASRADITAAIANNPEIAKFGEQLATTVAKEVAAAPGKTIRDPEFHAIATREADKLAKSSQFKGAIGDAVSKTLTGVTGFEDTTVKRVSKTTGLIKGIGRRQARSDVPFYEGQTGLYQDVYGMMGGNGKATGHLSHITAKGSIDSKALSKLQNASSYATAAVDRIKNKIIDVAKIGGSGRVSIPSSSDPKSIRDAAGFTGKGMTPVVEARAKTAAASKREAVAAEKSARSAELAAKSQARSDAARKGWETRRQNAIKTQVVAEETQSRGARLRGMMNPGKLGMAGMGASMALGMASSMGGPVGDIAGQLMGPMAAISGVASVLGMIPGPAGLVVAGLAAAGAAAAAVAISFNEAQDKAMKNAEQLGVGTEAMKGFAEFAGKVTAGEQMDKARENKFSRFQIQEGKTTFGQSYVASDQGKTMLSTLRDSVKAGGLKDIEQQITNQMVSAVASGALEAGQARSIVAELAKQMNNENLGIEINGKLIEILGPNGEDLAKDPLGVRLQAIEGQQESLKASEKLMQNVQQKTVDTTGGLNAAAAGALALGAALAPATGGISFIAGSVAALGLGITSAITYAQNLGAASGAAVAQGVMALQQGQEMLDSLDLQYQKRIEVAKAAGDLVAVQELSAKHEADRAKLLQANAETIKQATAAYTEADAAGFLGMGNGVKTAAMGQAVDKAIQARYADDPLMAAMAEGTTSQIKDAGGLNNTQEYTMKLMLATGDVSPMVLSNILGSFGEDTKTMDLVMNTMTNLGTADGAQALQLMNMFQNEDGTANTEAQKEFIATVEAKTPEDAKKYLDVVTEMTKAGEVVNLQAILDVALTDPAAMEEFMATMDMVKAQAEKGPLTVEYLQTILSPETMAAIKSDQQYFDSLPPEQQVTYTQTLLTIYETRGTPEYKSGLGAWLAETGKSGQWTKDGKLSKKEKSLMNQYEAAQAKKVTEASKPIGKSAGPVEEAAQTPSGGGGGGGGTPSSMLDDLTKKLKQVQMNTLAVTKGWAASRTALDNLFPAGGSNSPFNGIEQAMRRLGAKEDLITMIAGMDPDEFEKRKDELFTFDAAGNIAGFRNSLLSIGAALRSIKFGEFQSQQQKNVSIYNDQIVATRKLVAAGFSYAEAYDMVKDAALASAVAQESNNDIIKQATAEYKAAEAAAKNFAAAQAVAGNNQKVVDQKKLLEFMNANADQFTETQKNAIMSDENLQRLVLNPEVDPISLQQALTNAQEKAALELEIKKLTVKGMEEIFQDGFNKAMEAFSAQEKKIELEFKLKKDPFTESINAAKEVISDIQNGPGGLDDLDADLTRISNKERDIVKAYDEKNKALDKIQEANDIIARQQKSQLSIADALSQGDIAAAARAAEEQRAAAAAEAVTNQRKILDAAREAEINALTGQMGLTKEQIEARILDLKQQIFDIEELQIEPAQYQVELLERQEESQKRALTVLGMTRVEWETLNNRIQVAKTSSNEYKIAMEAARDVVGKIVEYWKEIEKPKTTVHTVITRNVTEGGAGNIGASGDSSGGGGGGGNSSTGTTPPPAAAPAVTAGATDTASLRSRYGKFSVRYRDRDSILNPVYSLYRTWSNNLSSGAVYQNASNLGKALSKYGYNQGGLVSGFGSGDTIPAMLTPGEFVVTKPAVDAFGASSLAQINKGNYSSGSVYNYSVSVNVNDADASKIAKTVISQIKSIDNQRIRGNRF